MGTHSIRMRLILVALLASSAFAAREKWSAEPLSESLHYVDSFKTGVEYRFNFDAQVSNGLPVPGTEQAALRFKALVALAFPQSETVAVLRLEKMRLGSLQKELYEPKKIQPIDIFDEIDLDEKQLSLLRLPIRFRYVDGIVSEIEFDREDLPWSMNIKRVYLNMLQVNLRRKNVHQSRFDEQNENQLVFSAPELTLEGDCEVVYSVIPESSERREQSELLVTKTINFDKCSRRVGHRYNLRFTDECPSCEKKFEGEERNIESSSVFNYRILGSPSRFLIKHVEVRSVYSYVPFSQEETLFTTFVSGELKLVEVTERTTEIVAPKSEKKEQLLYSMEQERDEERFLATGDRTSLERSPFTTINNKHEVITRLFKSIIIKIDDELEGIDLASTHEMERIVAVLRLCTKEEIKRTQKEMESEYESLKASHSSQMKELFADALAIAGTFNTVEHLIERIRARDFTPLKSSILLKHLTNIRVPSEKIIDSLISLCEDSKRQPLEQQSCWLTVGTLLNGLCGGHREKFALESTEEQKCPRDLKEKFIGKLVDQFDKAETRYQKVLALKTLANSGMDMIVFPLEKIINDKRQEKTVRMQAIDALRKLRSLLPRKIVSVLLPVYKNIRESPEIRVAAFHQIMQTIPEKSVIDQIVFQLDKEPSTQVKSFVYEALHQLSKSEISCEKPMVDSIKASLRLVRYQPGKTFSSTYKHFTLYNQKNEAGVTLNWAILFSNDSVLPKEVMTTLEATFAGQWNKYLAQIGVSQQNIDYILKKVLETVEYKGFEEIIVRGKRSTAFKPTEVLRGLFSKLSIVSRKQQEQDPHAMIYVRFHDMDYALLPLEEDVIPEVIKSIFRNGRIELGEIESILSKGLRFNTVLSSFVYERTRSIVHSMGSLLVYSSKMPTIARLEGVIKVELEPKNGKSFDGLRLRIQARPTLASTHVTMVEMVNPIVSLGVKLVHSTQINVPVDMTTEVNWHEKLMQKTTFTLPKESRRMLQLKSRPVSFVRVWPKEARAYVEPKEKTIYVDALESCLKHIHSSHLEDTITLNGHIHSHIWDQGTRRIPSAILIGENQLEVRFQKVEEAPKEIVLRTELEYFNEVSNVERPSMDDFFDNNNEEHFRNDEYEEFDNEKERRSHFKKYVKSYKGEKAYSHRFFGQIKSVGGRKERKAEIELKSVCDEKMRHCKLNINGLRSPLFEKETRDWTIQTEMEMLYPQMPNSLEELLAQKHRELSMTIDSKWGCDEKSMLTLKIQGDQDKEQKKWMKHVVELKERKDLSLTALEEYYLLIEASMLNQYKMVADYDIRCPYTRALIERLYIIGQMSTCIWKNSIEFVKNEEGVVRAKLTIDPRTRQYANLTIETPTEKLILRDFYLPLPMRLLNIRRQWSSPIRSFSNVGSALLEHSQAMCTVESRKVKSFDDVIYRTPLTTCYSVLAKDCASEEPSFAILMKKIDRKGEEKKMQVISRDTVVELEMDKKTKKMIVSIDGEETDKISKLEKARVFLQNGVVVVDLEDVNVSFDGYIAEIKMSDYFKNKQCGICGHFDGEKNSEFRRADNEETESLEEFHRSYLVRNDECDMEEEKLSDKKNYRLESDESSSEEESAYEGKWEKTKRNKKDRQYRNEEELVEPVEKTKTIEYSNRVCFSKSPVRECPQGTMESEDELEEIKVKYACLSRSDRRVPHLMRDARREILRTEDLLETFVETLTVPRYCIAY